MPIDRMAPVREAATAPTLRPNRAMGCGRAYGIGPATAT